MIDEIYNTKLLALAANIGGLQRLEHPDATAKAHSKLCGSTVIVDLVLDDENRAAEFGQDVKACALGQASASVMASVIIGASADELRQARNDVYAMLKQEGKPPEGRFSDMQYLLPVRDYKARHASTLLVFDAVVDALDQIEETRAA